MSHDLNSGQKIVDLYEKKIESQSTISVAFFGASLFIFSSLSSESKPVELQNDWILITSYVLFAIVVGSGFFARMSLVACVPPMLSFNWGSGDASTASFSGKGTLQGWMRIQAGAFLLALIATGVFFALNLGSFFT